MLGEPGRQLQSSMHQRSRYVAQCSPRRARLGNAAGFLCLPAIGILFEADGELLDLVQRQTFRFFWEGAHWPSRLARDHQTTTGCPQNDLVAIGGSGFGIMAIIVAVERSWVSRDNAAGRLGTMLSRLEGTPRYHGMFPHFINGLAGETIPFTRKDDGGDVVETAFLLQGLLCARQYFDSDTAEERSLRGRIDRLWLESEWDWYRRDAGNHLYWHWSPNHGWAMNRSIAGWNEGLLAYVLAAGSPDHPIDAEVYHQGFASGPGFRNGRSYRGIELPLGMNQGGPLFIAHYSFCGLDPAPAGGPPCGLLAPECSPHTCQLRALRRQSARPCGIWARLLGTDVQPRTERLYRPRA